MILNMRQLVDVNSINRQLMLASFDILALWIMSATANKGYNDVAGQ
ncbi:hypothetical protein [Calothrix sp. NIES-2098]|nr:hypothetical protein NIES2098_14030 [Calothrix sp. NIES-2098]